jgi:ferric-dicitrate binding protein FerR (iron transport regulator)
MTQDLDALAQLVRAELAPHHERAVDDARAGALLCTMPRRARTRWTARGAAVTGLLLVAAIGAMIGTVRGDDPSAITLVGSTRLDEPLPSRATSFTDGSRVEPSPASDARVLALDTHGGHIRLAHGALDASFRHRADTHWRVEAGAVEVHVTGTAFSVSWDPLTKRFGIVMRDGSVLLRGCGLDARAVRGGESLFVTCAPPSVLGSPTEAPPASTGGSGDVEPSSVPSPRSAPLASSAAPPPPRQSNPVHGRSQVRPDEQLADAGPSASEHAARADAARHARAYDEARALLVELRRRYPRSAEGTRASFDLGVIAFEHGSFTDAGEAFETYLREAPTGPLVREALGRAMESHERRGDRSGARDAACRYRGAFPSGPLAARARSLCPQDP